MLPQTHVVWCMDVLEHFPPCDQAPLLDLLRHGGRVVVVNLIEDQKADGQIHYPVDRVALTTHIEEQGPVLWEDTYQMADGNRSRVLMYGPAVRRQADGDVSVDLWHMPEDKEDQ